MPSFQYFGERLISVFCIMGRFKRYFIDSCPYITGLWCGNVIAFVLKQQKYCSHNFPLAKYDHASQMYEQTCRNAVDCRSSWLAPELEENYILLEILNESVDSGFVDFCTIQKCTRAAAAKPYSQAS